MKKTSLLLLAISIASLIVTYCIKEAERKGAEHNEIEAKAQRDNIQRDLNTTRSQLQEARNKIEKLIIANTELTEQNLELTQIKTDELKRYHEQLVFQLDRIHSPRLEVYKMVPSFGEMTLHFDNTGDKSITYANFQYKARLCIYKESKEIALIDEGKFYDFYHSMHPNPIYINPGNKFELNLGYPSYDDIIKKYDYDFVGIEFYLIRLRTKFFQSNDESLSLVIKKDGPNLNTSIDGTTFFRLKIR